MDGQLRREVGSMLGSVAGSTQGSIINGGFAYDEPAMQSLVKDRFDLAYDYEQSLDESVRPPPSV